MINIIRITVLSLLFSAFYQPVLSSDNDDLFKDINFPQPVEHAQITHRPDLSLESSNVYSSIPTGSVVSFAGDRAPHGWLLCNGDVYSESEYPKLYSVIGTTYVPEKSHANRLNQIVISNGFLNKQFCVPDLKEQRLRGSNPVDNNMQSHLVLNYIIRY